MVGLASSPPLAPRALKLLGRLQSPLIPKDRRSQSCALTASQMQHQQPAGTAHGGIRLRVSLGAAHLKTFFLQSQRIRRPARPLEEGKLPAPAAPYCQRCSKMHSLDACLMSLVGTCSSSHRSFSLTSTPPPPQDSHRSQRSCEPHCMQHLMPLSLSWQPIRYVRQTPERLN